MLKLVLVVCLQFLLYKTLFGLRCQDESGNAVDWFMLYKLPKLPTTSNPNPLIHNGSAYMYMTETNTNWTLSKYSINDTHSLPALILNRLYSQTYKSQDTGFLFYNDEADSTTFTMGHTKGFLVFDKETAIWVVHSIPHFPPKLSLGHYYINNSQLYYGQNMLCMSFNFYSLDSIGLQLLYNYPQVYDYFIPDSLKTNSVLNNLKQVINGDHVNKAPWFNIVSLYTIHNNYQFLSFAKFNSYHEDLYAGLVAPNLTSNIITETWNNGAGTLDSNCSITYHVNNIEYLSFDQIDVNFSVHKDHSKWVLTTSSNQQTVCFGDINRQITQFERGGGTVCLLNRKNVWNNFKLLVKTIQKCP